MRRLACGSARFAALLLLLPLAARGTASSRAEEPPAAPAPAAGPLPELRHWRVGVSLGSGNSYGHSYVMFSGIVGYQVAYGFEIAADGQYWGGANPHLGRFAPGIYWYAPIPFRPYAGVYYARWFVGGLPDQDALGGRAGISLASAPNTAFGAGLAFERALGCSSRCEAWWPELSIGFRF